MLVWTWLLFVVDGSHGVKGSSNLEDVGHLVVKELLWFTVVTEAVSG